jgi:hypothetical protein
MKNSEFRSWVQKIWQENIAERQDYRELPYSMEEYWNRYKFWLKREYKFQKIKDGQKT